MSKRHPQSPKAAELTWPYTPEPSPPQSSSYLRYALDEEKKMSTHDIPRSRPINMSGRRDMLSPSGRPTLEDVLNNTAPSPYTLAAYTAFLSQQHCLETLEFTTEAKKYATKYEEACSLYPGQDLTTESQEGFELMMDWIRLLDVYIKPGAPREINLPAEERDDLVDCPYEEILPPPSALDPSVRRMYDLMSDSIFIPFCNSLKQPAYAHTYSPMSEIMTRSGVVENSRLPFGERRSLDKPRSGRHRSPAPTTVPSSESRSTTSHANTSHPTRTVTTTSGASRSGGSRLTTHISGSSVASDSAMTDSSEREVSGDQDVMTPPTTPPMSDVGSHTLSPRPAMSYAQKTQRSESGGWKKMGMKIFGQNAKRPASERSERPRGT